jgi:protein arginine kinase activator
MLCEKCGKKQATTHIKKTVNGVHEEHHYCSECAKQSGINAFPSFGSFGAGGLFGSLMGLPFGEFSSAPSSDAPRCPGCGISFAEIANSGKVGCAKCYDTFRDRLLPSVERIHGRSSHMGKTPDRTLSEEDKRKAEIKDLQDKLQKAVEAQEYEQAAKYRDEIKKMEGEQQ